MEVLNLKGEWLLEREGNEVLKGHLPGCTYLDYMANGMEDPFRELNETKATELAKNVFIFSRDFEADKKFLDMEHIDFVGDGIDTVCSVYINGDKVGECENIHRTYRFDIKDSLVEGINNIRLVFEDPYKYVAEKNEADPLPKMSMIKGIGHIRKTQSNFGWDWGPALAPAGVTRSIEIQGYNERITDVKFTQKHEKDRVFLTVSAKANVCLDVDCENIFDLEITDPNGKQVDIPKPVVKEDTCTWEVIIHNPMLWWTSALGRQDLYRVAVGLHDKTTGLERDKKTYSIGLRTIELDTSRDADGEQFKFILNGVPLFIHGADWIPADSFITRADRETIDFYIDVAKNAGMNMLRVWGGGTYETEHFYDACDRNGILVWQDFGFACSAYPFYDDKFLANVKAEVNDNIRRLRHRASLALWCGNNENELFDQAWKRNKKIYDSNQPFYHKTLREWVEELDGERPFWPGSPSSGHLRGKVHNMKPGEISGDTHLWQVWHGMEPIEAYRKFPTRMCTEFGMESLPSMKAIRAITDEKNVELLDPVMKLHQKSDSGNEKMLFYVLSKYRNPAKFEDFIYLSQLVQSAGLRFASDTWRRNIGKQNGAVYWQLNDCWPVASWSAIDYLRQPKAVLYHAKQFNKPLAVINDYYKNHVNLFVANEYPREFSGKLIWRVKDFYGNPVSSGSCGVEVDKVSAKNLITLEFKDVLDGRKKEDVYLEVELSDGEKTVDTNSWLLVPDRDASLPKAEVKTDVIVKNGMAEFTFTSKTYARYVFAEADSINAPWSDNFFDILPGEEKKVRVPVREGLSAQNIASELKIKTLTDVVAKGSNLTDKLIRLKFMLKPANIISWLIFKVVF